VKQNTQVKIKRKLRQSGVAIANVGMTIKGHSRSQIFLVQLTLVICSKVILILIRMVSFHLYTDL